MTGSTKHDTTAGLLLPTSQQAGHNTKVIPLEAVSRQTSKLFTGFDYASRCDTVGVLHALPMHRLQTGASTGAETIYGYVLLGSIKTGGKEGKARYLARHGRGKGAVRGLARR